MHLSLAKVTARRPQGRALQSFFGPNFATDFGFLPADRNQRQGPIGAYLLGSWGHKWIQVQMDTRTPKSAQEDALAGCSQCSYLPDVLERLM
jgi:hypothetical protein